MAKRQVIAATVTWLLLGIMIGGCSSLLGPLSGDQTDYAEFSQSGPNEVPYHQMSVQERLAVRSVRNSPEYESISGSMLRGSTPLVLSPNGEECVVVFSLAPETGKEVRSGKSVVYPYVMFIADPATEQLLEVYKVSPDMDSGTLLVESLVRDESSNVPMDPDVLAELSGEPAANSVDSRGNPRVTPKYECDESLTYPKTVCWCTEYVHHPATLKQPQFDYCTTACSVLPPAQASACTAACCILWIVFPYDECVAQDCQTIYPCPW